MRTLINILLIVFSSGTISWSHEFVNAEHLEYSLSSKNIVYGREGTFIFLKISNKSGNEAQIPGYAYYLQRFTAYDDKENKISGSQNIRSLRLSKLTQILRSGDCNNLLWFRDLGRLPRLPDHRIAAVYSWQRTHDYDCGHAI